MFDRFTHRSRLGRGKIPRLIREQVFTRDQFECQFCGSAFSPEDLTIDHLVPLARGGLDEITNYVTCCRPCNQQKADLPLDVFAQRVRIPIEDLPVHGDPVVDNPTLPVQIRLLRKRVFDRIRIGDLRATGRQAQKKIEKAYRRDFWQTEEGKALEAEFPNLPGHVRVMLPEIRTLTSNEWEFFLLVELAKSASTRNLLGSVLKPGCDVEARLAAVEARPGDPALSKRIKQARERFERGMRQRLSSGVGQQDTG